MAFTGWGNMRSIDPSGGRGNPLAAPGVYDVRVKLGREKNGRRGVAFVFEFEVINTNHPHQPVGSSADFYQDFEYPESGYAAIKGFICACLGFCPKTQKEQIKASIDPQIEQISLASVGQQNFLAGKLVHVETTYKLTKGKGKRISVMQFSPYNAAAPLPPMQSEASVQAHLAMFPERPDVPQYGAPQGYPPAGYVPPQGYQTPVYPQGHPQAPPPQYAPAAPPVVPPAPPGFMYDPATGQYRPLA